MKKFLAGMLSVIVLSLSSVQAFAEPISAGAEILKEGSDQEVPITLTAEPMYFSVSVPVSLPVVVDSAGTVYAANNAQIVNNGCADIAVTNLVFQGKEGYTLCNFDTFEGLPNTLAVKINSVKSIDAHSNNFTTESFGAIAPNGGSLSLLYDVKLPTMYEPLTARIADVIFTIDWSDTYKYENKILDGIVVAGPFDQVTGGTVTAALTGNAYFNFWDTGTKVDTGIWESSDPSVVSINANTGEGKILSNGSSTITFTTDSQESHSILVNVNLTDQPVLDASYFNSTVKNFHTLNIVDHAEVPEDAYAGPWDVSVGKTGEILAWKTDSRTAWLSGNGSGRILMEPDSSGLLADRYWCDTINGIDILDSRYVTNMDSIFYDVEVTDLDLSSWNTQNVVSAYQAFAEMDSLTSIEVSNRNMTNLVSAERLFYGSDAITSIDLSGWDTSSLENVQSMFYDCDSLSEIKTPHINTKRVTNVQYTFSNCPLLESLDISAWDLGNATPSSNFMSSTVKFLYLKSNAEKDKFAQIESYDDVQLIVR